MLSVNTPGFLQLVQIYHYRTLARVQFCTSSAAFRSAKLLARVLKVMFALSSQIDLHAVVHLGNSPQRYNECLKMCAIKINPSSDARIIIITETVLCFGPDFSLNVHEYV